MATVSNFEMTRNPGKSALRQFEELFLPLFQASSDEARRQAVAALSRSAVIPPALCRFIGLQPISIAALFLTRSPAMSDELLIEIAREGGEDHAHAIALRDDLSPLVVDTLVGLRYDDLWRSHAEDQLLNEALAASHETPVPTGFAESGGAQAALPSEPEQQESASTVEPATLQEDIPDAREAERLANEEKLRQHIKGLTRHLFPPDTDRQGYATLDPLQEALLLRFGRINQVGYFITALSDVLSSTIWLAERILLDMSGTQLAIALVALGMKDADASEILCGLFPDLRQPDGHGRRADSLLEALDRRDCERRLDAWCRADRYTYAENPSHAEEVEEAAEPVVRLQQKPRRFAFPRWNRAKSA